MLNIVAINLETLNRSLNVHNLKSATLYKFIDPLNFSNLTNFRDSLGEEALFALEEDGFSVSLVLIVPENLGTRRVEDIPGPSPGAVHTLGVVDRVEEIRLNTLPAHIKITERANGLFMIYFVELFTTNVALCSHLVLYY